jgi:hypothetical protein
MQNSVANAKKINKVIKPEINLEVINILSNFKDKPEWSALKVVMKTYINNRMSVAYNMDEKDPSFAIRHAKESAQALAFKYLIRFIEKEIRRFSQEDGKSS